MSMLSSELEFSLNEAFGRARENRHEFITVEHLLSALLQAPLVAKILAACGANLDKLGTDLDEFIDQTTPRLPGEEDRDVQPTLGFQRVLQRAVFHVQSSGKKEVTGVNVLVAIFGEKQSQATYLLSLHGVSRLDVVNYISHGMAKADEGTGESATEEGAGAEPPSNPLEQYATNLNRQAQEGRIDPLIGRDLEIERTIQILCRRRKNNPLYRQRQVGGRSHDCGIISTQFQELSSACQFRGAPMVANSASSPASRRARSAPSVRRIAAS